MTRRRAKPPSQRQLRVGEEIRHLLSDILGHGSLRDPVLTEANITVSEVRVSPDLRNATAYVSQLGGGEMADVLAALKRATPHLRSRLGRELKLRHTPDLRFEADRSFDEAARIEALLRQPRVQRDLDSGAEADAETDGNDGEEDEG